MRYCLTCLLMMWVLAVQGLALQAPPPKSAVLPEQLIFPLGRWQVKFTMAGLEKNLILDAQAGGVASFVLLDTGPDNGRILDPQPAAWSQLTNNRVSICGEVELPIGTCCREMGTLIFKGKLSSNNSMLGKLIFVTSIDEEESPYGFRSIVGKFTATRALK